MIHWAWLIVAFNAGWICLGLLVIYWMRRDRE